MALLRLRDEQMARFAEAARADLVARLRAFARRAYPEAVALASDAQLDALLRAAIDEAAMLGLAHEPSVVRFVAWRFELGAGFDARPAWAWIGAVLRDRRRDERARVHAVDARLAGQEEG